MGAGVVTPYVLAGGRSTRMGRDKAFLELDGVSLLEFALRRTQGLGEARILSGDAEDMERRARLAQFGPTVPDRVANAGPLGGIDAALADAPGEWVMVVPVDQPFLPAEALEAWFAEVSATGVKAAWLAHPGGTEPLPLLVHRSLGPAVEAALLHGERRVLTVMQAVVPGAVATFRRETEWFRNLNSPGDLPGEGSH